MNFDQEILSNIKVYKTDVADKTTADEILNKIRRSLPGSEPSFDLEDCDNVLRVEIRKKPVDDVTIRELVKATGHHIEELP